MPYFSLTDGLKVWDTYIDSDHQHFVDLLNDFHAAMTRGEGEEVLGKLLNELILYTREHFKREEDYMRDVRYADFDAHKEEHDKLIKDLLLLQARFITGDGVVALQVSSFLRNWLVSHIMATDKKLASAAKQGAGLI